MHIRRPIAALFVSLALFGGGTTLTACEAAGQDQNDGTPDGSSNTSGADPGGDEQGNLPDLSHKDSGTSEGQNGGGQGGG
jgi:hypothetical protein